jgi:predicted methyltransferase
MTGEEIAIHARTAIAAALAAPGRPARDRARDKRDQTAKLLAFAALRPGDVVADFLPFRGYYTRLFAVIVGPAGRVDAVVPRSLQRIERIKDSAAEVAACAQALPNVRLIDGEVAQAGALPEQVDLFWISQNYHDLHNPFMGPVDIAAFNVAVFDRLNPAGRLIIIDHVAAADAPPDVTDTKHRIVPAVARREIEEAGFVWDGQCDALVNRTDSHAESAFARRVRYHTDRFAYRFRKPA